MRLAIKVVFVALLGTAGFYGYRAWNDPTQEHAYHRGRVERGEIVATVTATGTIEPVLKVLVGSQVSGTVVKWYADFNQEVSEGDVLAELDQAQFAATITQRKANVAVAVAHAEEEAAKLKDAQLDLARIVRAHAAQSASDDELGEAQTAVDGTLAALHAAQAEIEVAQAELHAAQIQFDKTIIRSPIDGVVISRNIDAGQTVAASLSAPTLFTIANDLRRMRVNAAVSETDVGQVRENMPASFRVDAYPERRFQGVVTQVRYAETVVDNVVTYETLIEVENDDLALRPGMTATVRFEVQRVENVLKVPNAALRFDPERSFRPAAVWTQGRAEPPKPRVFVPVADQLNQVDVEPGITDGAFTQILGGALEDGDIVVVGWDLSSRRARP